MKIGQLLVIALTLVMFSCSTQRSPLTYFEDIKTQTDGVIPAPDSYVIKIVPDDELLITVTSTVPEATAEYNLPLSNPAKNGSLLEVTQPKQQTFLVDKAGDINFPRLGMIHVAGMTTSELQNLLAKKISTEVEDPVVKVSLVNFRVNVLGEVKNPGTIGVNRERFSILDALGAAGDLTEYAERNNILLIREVDGKKEFHHLNLNDAALLSSPYYYLQQNDAIYVEPNKIRKDNSKYNQNNAFKLSMASAIISASSVIASLVIALTVK
ncbi:MAG: polysaccharide biosynthesis/export family protein [Muribaculum sp.]|nr:polysaccharide biosynthesis/export family protein [Muribaculum sp.]